MEATLQAYLVGVLSGILLLAGIIVAFLPVRGRRQ